MDGGVILGGVSRRMPKGGGIKKNVGEHRVEIGDLSSTHRSMLSDNMSKREVDLHENGSGVEARLALHAY